MNIRLIPNQQMQDQLYDMVGHRKVLHIVCEESPIDVTNRKNKIISKNKIKRKPVYCITTAEIYPSIKEAAMELILDPGAISKVCNGKQQSTNGYKFRYQE